MKKLMTIFTIWLALTSTGHTGESATPQEIFDNVLKGMEVLEALGEEGLEAFKDPKGEFVWKDTYVQVYNCGARQIVGHINPKLLAWTPEKFDSIRDKKDNPITKLICDASKNPNGGWVEYLWPKPGETKASRKITFVVQVPGHPYQVSAGIYDDNVSLKDLKKINE